MISHRRLPHPGRGAFTLIELLTVVAIIGILMALLMPAITRGIHKARDVVCGSNLRQQGIGYHLFAHEHQGQFPQHVPVSDGGAREANYGSPRLGNLFVLNLPAFRALSNDLGAPKVLVCPAARQLPSRTFSWLQYSNISYYNGLLADFSRPNSILGADHNLLARRPPHDPRYPADSLPNLAWTSDRHHERGTILFAAGHVELIRSLSALATSVPMSTSPSYPPAPPAPPNSYPGDNTDDHCLALPP